MTHRESCISSTALDAMRMVIAAQIMLFGSVWTARGDATDSNRTEQTFSPDDVAFFEKRIRPLFVNQCGECHSAKAKNLKGGLLLDSRASILEGGDSGPALVPGRPEDSLLISAVRYGDDAPQMPPAGKLSDQQIGDLVQWVKLGAPAPQSESVVRSTKRGIDMAAARRFWSFQPAKKQKIAADIPSAWIERRIDAFVLEQLQTHDLAPSKRASPGALMRRATFDLIGLPPTPDEVDAFVHDSKPDAFVRLVDRLLASPHYGERWARVWLDVARYTDVTASWLSSTRRAYAYRDWVAQALNDDIPYDAFVVRQLATDMMSETGPEDVAALGFLGLSPTYWKELKLDSSVIKTIVADEWEERIDAVGRSFLGLTLACARCHDHKFDPVGVDDYYALAGVFASTRLIDRPMIADAEAKPALQARELVTTLEERIKSLKSKKPVPDENARQVRELQNLVAHLKRSTPNYDLPMAHAVSDSSLYVLPDGKSRTRLEYRDGEVRELPIFVRGDPSNPGKEKIPRRFLRILSDGDPEPFTIGSGRLELARAIVTDGAPLAARVIVNRVWMQHFGRGLVDTPSNFGTQGARPSHPKLLDDLTARFVENGWSIKWLHREIMLSAAYQQSSEHDEHKASIDPTNRWLWRMNRRRLAVEMWRDAMLAVTANLDPTIGGPSVALTDPTNRRRTLYGSVERRDLDVMLRLYDFPEPTAHSPSRNLTTTPLQQLFVLNSPFIERQAARLAERMTKSQDASLRNRVQYAYRLLFGRPASDREVQLADLFLNGPSAQSNPQDCWQRYAHVLLGCNEFMFVD